MMKYGNITCKRCGVTWYGPKCGKLYCDNCRRIVDREKDIRCKKKRNTNRHLLKLQEWQMQKDCPMASIV